jgi:hypothetical protein
LAQNHPEVISPEQWDYALAADFVEAVDQLNVDDWRSPNADLSAFNQDIGKPLMPRTKASFLATTRMFFLDLQDAPHQVGTAAARTISRRFNPLRALQTPRAIRCLIGPNPRVIDDKLWLKLLYASENLEASDLQRYQLGMYPFELIRAMAVTWCLSGLRTDEIRRLRVGCIRWRIEDNMAAESGTTFPEDALCFLSVPVNKTATAFTKPVHSLIGRRMEEWERVRPAQAPVLDAKTNELVNFLFSV